MRKATVGLILAACAAGMFGARRTPAEALALLLGVSLAWTTARVLLQRTSLAHRVVDALRSRRRAA